MNSKKALFPLLLLPLVLTACDGAETSPSNNFDSNPTSIDSNNGSDSTSEENGGNATIKIDGADNGTVIEPEDVTLKDTLHSIENQRFYNTRVLPSTGDVNILVIPVLMPDYQSFTYAGLDSSLSAEEKQAAVKGDIEQAFFGEKSAEGIQSVASYYKEASFGKLNLSGFVTDWYNAKDSGITASASLTIDGTLDLVQDAVDWAFKNYDLNRKDYDYDGDGFYDGIWVIYSAEDYSRNGPYTDDQNFWAYTSWGNQNMIPNPDMNRYYYNLFGWASYDFMYDTYDNHVDAHTYIHETGHFLGLNDYYSDRPIYNPVGKVDMMDGNIGDHNSYSKMILGWEKPYIVTGDATITIEPQKENSFIVIPADGTTFANGVFDPFSEYVLIELYSPEGLNEVDRKHQVADRPVTPDDWGVRIYHVDNRRFVTSYDDNQRQYVTVEDDGGELESGEKYILPITNSINFNQYYTDLNLSWDIFPYDEIRLIEAGGKNTFSSGGFQMADTFFHAGSTFSLEEYDDFFLNPGHFDNGKTFSTKVSIESIKED